MLKSTDMDFNQVSYLPERVTLKLDPGFIIIIISYKTVICFLLSDKYFHSQVFEVESYIYRYRELGLSVCMVQIV